MVIWGLYQMDWGDTKLFKVVIAEDNDLLRRQLVNIISTLDDFEIVYSTNNGIDLCKVLTRIKPDVVISDIDMPGMNGIEAITKVRALIPDTEIVFITAFDQFIKDAVQLYATDFIGKPLNIQRLKDTMERIIRRMTTSEQLIDFRSEGSVVVVRAKELYFVEAIKKKTKIYTEKGDFISYSGLKDVEDMLGEGYFFKTSRSYIVNLTKVRSLQPISRTSFQIIFDKNDWVAYLSKNLYGEFREKLKKYHS